MQSQFAQDTSYWLHKTKAFLHDPPDKAIHIPGHEERANALLAALGINSSLSKEEYRNADIIASGMDRACLPGYVAGDESRNGAVNFYDKPAITHPTGGDGELTISLPDSNMSGKDAVTAIAAEMLALLKNDLGDDADKKAGQGLSEQEGYRGNETAFAPARFHYLFFMLRRRLAQNNVGGLGGLWHRLPADTRLPDHSIWQHCGLVSALASCERLSEQNKTSLMVYAISPVQDFVGRARKLRDYWAGSIILSWLAFEGIKAVIYQLGADHLVYPSLHGQPLMDDLLRDWQRDPSWFEQGGDAGIASFPNKFVCLVPAGLEQQYAASIEQAIAKAWRELGDATLGLLVEKMANVGGDATIAAQFDRQLHHYWEHHWAAVPLIKGDARVTVEDLLHKVSVDPAFSFWQGSNAIWSSTGEGPLYSVSHRLVQAGLAAGKSRRTELRQAEAGIKCDLFGEFEIIHYGEQEDHNPKPSEDPFWQDIRRAFADAEFGAKERLCALGIVKRLAHRVCRKLEGHPLRKMFVNAEKFPSTTEMALCDWWRQVNEQASNQDEKNAVKIAEELAVFNWSKGDDKTARSKVAQWLHAINEPEQVKNNGCEITPIDLSNRKEKSAARELFKLHEIKDIHKYYAVLMMDGDKMGKLINGETLGSTWQTVLHPELAEKLRGNFESKFKKFWSNRLAEPRLVSPAVHAAISEALGDFSLHTVPAIIAKFHGRLIYAGGDDVCAVLPASTALDAAREIADTYCLGFVTLKSGHQATAVSGSWQPEAGSKLALHLGSGDKISISAGIMIAHHKKPLGRVIDRAHALLEMAKNEGGRNAFALEVDKRSGGGRTFMAGWREEKNGVSLLDHFLATAAALQRCEGAAMSSSLAYRLATFEDGLHALLTDHPAELPRFVAKQLDRSGLNRNLDNQEDGKREVGVEDIAGHVAALIGRKDYQGKLPLESLIVANFIGHCQRERGVL